MTDRQATISIVDYGLGNLFSIQQACQQVGLRSIISDDPAELGRADAVLLPGVGAFGDAMTALEERSLVRPLQDIAASGKTLIGICLGLQLLMTGSREFGDHPGLGVIKGTVERLPDGLRGATGNRLKVPHVGWRPVEAPNPNGWRDPFLVGIDPQSFMYFVHSYTVQPSDPGVVSCQTRYGDHVFCSAVHQDNIVAYQFHPERSAFQGMRIFRNIADHLSKGGR